MRKRLPSASALDRAFNCAASEVLPHMQSTSEYAAIGTAVHAFIESARKNGREAALAAVDVEAPHRAFCEALPLDQLPTGGDYEVPIAWDYVTDRARVLPDGGGHRDYSDVKPTEFVGTCDFVGRVGEVAIDGDWKTGFRYLGPPKQSRQLRFGALATARLAGLDEARVFYARLREDGSVFFSWASFDAFELAAIAEEMRGLAEILADAVTAADPSDPLDFHEGEHCDYCPAFNSCPAKVRLALAIGSGDAHRDIASLERQVTSMTDVQLATAYEKLSSFLKLGERVKKAIHQRGAMHPLDLGDGRVLGTVQWPWTAINAGIAHEVVTEKLGAEVADRVVPRKATLTAIEKLDKGVLEAIERRGGVVTGTKPQVRVHRPKDGE